MPVHDCTATTPQAAPVNTLRDITNAHASPFVCVTSMHACLMTLLCVPGHSQMLALQPYWIDINLVTNADYAAFLAESGFEPRDKHNWLRHWLSPPANV